MNILGLTRYRSFSRYREIVKVLFKYGFGYVAERTGLASLVPERIRKREFLGHPPLTGPQRLRMAMEELGPTFIKLGQMLSTRPDLIPMDYVVELSRLQDRVPPISFDSVKEQLSKGLSVPPEELFEEFDKTPIATASISQVHRAVLKTKEVVAVKVQKPGIKRIIEMDIDILYSIAHLIKKHFPDFTSFDPIAVVDEFSKSIRREMDFRREARNAIKFAEMFKDDPRIYEPRIYRDLCSDIVLIMEFVNFIKVTDIQKLTEAGVDPKKIAINGADLLFRQIFIHGFFHADPHPGNLGILPDGRIVFLDFGMMGRVGSELRDVIGDLFVAAIRKDATGIVEAYRALGMIGEDVDERAFKEDIEDFLDDYYNRPLKEIKIGEVINEAGIIALRYKIKVPAEFAMLGKALFTIEDVGQILDENFDVFSVAQPYVKQILLQKYNPERLSRDFENTLRDLIKLFYVLPKKSSRILDKIEKGKLKIEIKQDELEDIGREMRKSSIRIGLSFIFGSGMIAFAMLFTKLQIADWAVVSAAVGMAFIVYLVLLLRF